MDKEAQDGLKAIGYLLFFIFVGIGIGSFLIRGCYVF